MLKIRMRKPNKAGILLDQRGFTLLEEIIAVALMGIIVTALFVGLRTITLLNVDTSTHEISKDIAASSMDYIYSQPYQTSASNYNLPSPPTRYRNFITSLTLTPINPTEQKIALSISFGNKVVYTLIDYRTNY